MLLGMWAYSVIGLGAVEWGTVPDWFAAVGTVSAFGLGYFQYRRYVKDRQFEANERRYENARNLIITDKGGVHEATGSAWTFILDNKGMHPFQNVVIVGKRDDEAVGRSGPSLVPQGQQVSTIVRYQGGLNEVDGWTAEFDDHWGNSWSLRDGVLTLVR